MSILFISNNNFGFGLSGGDRILTQLVKHWSLYEKIGIMGSPETRSNLISHSKIKYSFYQIDTKNKNTKPTVINIISHQLKRTLKSLYYIAFNFPEINRHATIYSASDFFPDLIPAILLKIFNKNKKLICGYYLFAPNPFSKNSPYKNNHQTFKNIVYFLGQKISLILVNLFADYVFITSIPDKKYFPGKKIVVVKGGVDTKPIKNWLKKHPINLSPNKKYLACFIGRFHPQKGIVELIDIWKKVVKIYPKSRLAIIGHGELKETVQKKIQNYKLSKNISLLGYLDGQAKNNVFRNSAMILHPAIYDSGGMAAAEAMAWGLPGISFNLPSLKSYYPQGMLKVKCYDTNLFANTIVKLASDSNLYQKVSLDAFNLIHTKWDWQKRANKIFKQIQ